MGWLSDALSRVAKKLPSPPGAEKLIEKLPKPMRSKAEFLNRINPAVSLGKFNRAVGESGGDFQKQREALRQNHYRMFRPFDKKNEDFAAAEKMLKSRDPATRVKGQKILATTNAATMRTGAAGAKVGSLFVGGYLGAAVKAAAGAARAPQPLEVPASPFPQNDTLPYSYDATIPLANMRGGVSGVAPPRPGLLDLLYSLLVRPRYQTAGRASVEQPTKGIEVSRGLPIRRPLPVRPGQRVPL